jgi:glutamine synthetase adenylyltransferase
MILKNLLSTHKNNLSVELYLKKFSPYLHDLYHLHTQWLLENQDKNFDDLYIFFAQILKVAVYESSQDDLMHLMRIIKGRSSLMIALCDIFGDADVYCITDMLSKIADLMLQTAFKAGCLEWINRNKLPITKDTLEGGSGLIRGNGT